MDKHTSNIYNYASVYVDKYLLNLEKELLDHYNKCIRENNKNNFERLEKNMKILEEKNKFVDIEYDIKVKRK